MGMSLNFYDIDISLLLQIMEMAIMNYELTVKYIFL